MQYRMNIKTLVDFSQRCQAVMDAGGGTPQYRRMRNLISDLVGHILIGFFYCNMYVEPCCSDSPHSKDPVLKVIRKKERNIDYLCTSLR